MRFRFRDFVVSGDALTIRVEDAAGQGARDGVYELGSSLRESYAICAPLLVRKYPFSTPAWLEARGTHKLVGTPPPIVDSLRNLDEPVGAGSVTDYRGGNG